MFKLGEKVRLKKSNEIYTIDEISTDLLGVWISLKESHRFFFREEELETLNDIKYKKLKDSL